VTCNLRSFPGKFRGVCRGGGKERVMDNQEFTRLAVIAANNINELAAVLGSSPEGQRLRAIYLEIVNLPIRTGRAVIEEDDSGHLIAPVCETEDEKE
jgi:hypothetical protein